MPRRWYGTPPPEWHGAQLAHLHASGYVPQKLQPAFRWIPRLSRDGVQTLQYPAGVLRTVCDSHPGEFDCRVETQYLPETWTDSSGHLSRAFGERQPSGLEVCLRGR